MYSKRQYLTSDDVTTILLMLTCYSVVQSVKVTVAVISTVEQLSHALFRFIIPYIGFKIALDAQIIINHGLKEF